MFLYHVDVKMEPDNAEFTGEFFDESSRMWMENKVRKGAMIYYRCHYTHSTSRRCPKAAESVYFCKQHRSTNQAREFYHQKETQSMAS